MSNTDIDIEFTNEQGKQCIELYVRTKLSSASVEVFDRTLLENSVDDKAALYAAIINEQIINILIEAIDDAEADGVAMNTDGGSDD